MATKWCTKLEVALKRCPIVFQGHTSNCKVTRLKKIIDFDPNWAFPDCNSSLNSPMAMKCCTKLETAKERCPIVFQGHPSNFKVTRDKTSPILTQIGRFRTIGRSQLSNPSDLPCFLIYALLQSLQWFIVAPACILSWDEIWTAHLNMWYFLLDEGNDILING